MNWNLPTLTDLYTDFLSLLKGRDTDLAKGLDPAIVTVTNPEANFIRWNSANNYWEKFNGTTWAALSSAYAIQVGAFTGEVTKPSGNSALTIANGVVTYAKMQNVSAANMALGRISAGAGSVEEFSVTVAARSVLDDPTVAAMRTTLAIAGKSAVPVPVTAMSPRATNGCATLATTAGAANQPDVDYLAFDGAAKEYARFCMRMPKGWNEGTVTADFSWRRASGVGAANVVWGIRAVAVSDNETPAAAFGSDATVTDAASTTTANMNLSGETGACTIGGSPAELDLVFFEVFRDGAAGADTLDGVDAWLTEITLFVTLNETNDA